MLFRVERTSRDSEMLKVLLGENCSKSLVKRFTRKVRSLVKFQKQFGVRFVHSLSDHFINFCFHLRKPCNNTNYLLFLYFLQHQPSALHSCISSHNSLPWHEASPHVQRPYHRVAVLVAKIRAQEHHQQSRPPLLRF